MTLSPNQKFESWSTSETVMSSRESKKQSCQFRVMGEGKV